MSGKFLNNRVDISELPDVEANDFIKLERRYLGVMRLRTFIIWLGITAGVLLLTGIFEAEYCWIYLTAGSIPLLLMMINEFLLNKAFNKRGYIVRERDVVYAKGLIIYKELSIPFGRVQGVEIRQSFLSRLYKLYSIEVLSADISGNLKIHGLKKEDVEKIRSYILSQTDLNGI